MSEEAFLSASELRVWFAETLTDDPVFGFMRPWTIESYLDPGRVRELKSRILSAKGLVLVISPGASYLAEDPALLLSVNASRWALQQRQRAQLQRHSVSRRAIYRALADPHA